MNLHDLLSSPAVYRLGWTLVHSLWQIAAVAAALWLTLALLRRRSPQARYLAASLAMAAVLALTVLTFLWVSPPAPSLPLALAHTPPPVAPSPTSPTPPDGSRVDSPTNPPAPSLLPIPQPDPSVSSPSSLRAPSDLRDESLPASLLSRAQSLATYLQPALPWLVTAWLIGVLALSLWRAGGYVAACRLRTLGTRPVGPDLAGMARRLASALGLHRPVGVLQSVIVHMPLVIGWLRPVILLPVAALAPVTGLAPAHIEAVLAHELAHIRRLDGLVNLLQALLETLFFYHPALWSISRRMRIERERCCDDLAVAACGNRIHYVEALAALVQTHTAAPTFALASGLLGSSHKTAGSDLLARIRRLLGLADPASSLPGRSLAAVLVVLLALALPVGLHLSARASDPLPAATQPAGELESSLVMGRVVDVEGKGLAQAVVSCDNPAWTATTGSDGSFPLPPTEAGRSLSVTIRAAGYWPRTKVGLYRIADGTYQPDNGVFQLHKAGRLEGRVIGLDGRPLAGAPLSLSTIEQYLSSVGMTINHLQTITNAEGEFVIDLAPPGRLVLYYPWGGPRGIELKSGKWAAWVKPGEDIPSTPVKGVCAAMRIQLGDGETKRGLTLDLSQSTASLEGRVLDKTGRPVADAKAALFWKEEGGSLAIKGRGYGYATTDSEGRYRLDRLPLGAWHVGAWLGKAEAKPVAVELIAKKTAHQDMQLDASLEEISQSTANVSGPSEGSTPATQPASSRIPALIGQLGSPSAKEREEAQKALVEIGEPALETLKAAFADTDIERASRAIQVIERIEESKAAAVMPWLNEAAVRLAQAAGGTWRVHQYKPARVSPWLGAAFTSGKGVNVPYIVLPFPLDNMGEAKVKRYRQMNNNVLDIIASNERYIVLAGPAREPELTAKILATLGRVEMKPPGSARPATQLAAGRIPALIGQLGSPSAKEREEAQKALVEIGPEATRALKAAGNTDAERATQPVNKLKATLPSGAEIELVALSRYPDRNQPFWRPDGTRFDEPPFDTTGLDVTSTHDPKRQKIELVFRVSGKAAEPGYESQIWRTDGGGHWWAGRRSKAGQFLPDLKIIGISVPADMQTLSLDLRAAAGPWQSETSDGLQAKGRLSGAKDAPNCTEPSAMITARVDTEKEDTQVVAIDRDGIRHVSRPADTRGKGDVAEADFVFSRLTPTNIKSFTLETRPYEMIHLKDISLVPGLYAAAEVTSGSPQTQPAASQVPALIGQLGSPSAKERATSAPSPEPQTVRQYDYEYQLIRELGKMDDMRGQPNDFELIHKRAAELEQQYSKPEEKAKICLAVLLCHAASGNRGAEEALVYAQKASTLPMQAVDRARLFLVWPTVLDHTRRGTTGADLARFRKESTILRLRCIQIAEAYQVPEDLPPQPGRGVMFGTPQALREAIEKERAEYEFASSLHLFRFQARNHIVYYYTLNPLATTELAGLARSILGDGQVSQSLVQDVEKAIQARTKPPANPPGSTAPAPSEPATQPASAPIPALVGPLGSASITTQPGSAQAPSAERWGEPVEGLRGRIVEPNGFLAVGAAPTVQAVVENVAKTPILWQCTNEISMLVAVPGVAGLEPWVAPKFTATPGPGARQATADEVRSGFPGIGFKVGALDLTGAQPVPGYYRLAPGGRLTLEAALPGRPGKPGRYQVDCRLMRQVKSNEWVQAVLECPPIVVGVVGSGQLQPPLEDPTDWPVGPWGQAVEGMQVRLYDDESFLNPGGKVPHLSLDARNFGTRQMQWVLAPEWIDIEVDGLWYSATSLNTGLVPAYPFGPGNRQQDIGWSPQTQYHWKSKEGKALEFGPGQHTIRLAVTFHPATGNPGKPVCLTTNAIIPRPADQLPRYRKKAPGTEGAATQPAVGRIPALIEQLGSPSAKEVEELKASATAIRAKYPQGGREMWEELARLVRPGMTLRQMKAILPPSMGALELWHKPTNRHSYKIGGPGRQYVEVELSQPAEGTEQVVQSVPRIKDNAEFLPLLQPATQPAATPIPALIGQLGSASAKEREEAQKALVEIGEPATRAPGPELSVQPAGAESGPTSSSTRPGPGSRPGAGVGLMGKVVKVAGKELVIEVSGNDGPREVSIPTDEEATINVDMEPGTLADLKPGMVVTVSGFPAKMGIAASSRSLFGEIVRVEGKNVIIRGSQAAGEPKEVTVSTNERTRVLTGGLVSSDAADNAGGVLGLEDLEPQMVVQIFPASGPAEKIVVLPRTNVTTDGKKTILAIEGLPGTLAPESPGGPIWTSVSGVVVRVDGNTIVFNARLREGGTKEAVLVTDEETRILVDGEVGKVADLQPGMGLAIRRRRATPPLPGEVNVHATSEGLRGTFRKTEGRNVILTTTSPGGPPKETTVLTDGKTRVILLDWFLRPEPGTLRDIESGKLITVFPETGTATKIIVSVGARASTRPAPFTQPAATRIPALIGPLGSASAKEREEAQKALVEIGEPALEALKAATQPGSGVGVPFPEAQQESEDAAVSRLIDRAEGRNGVDGLRAREELVAMGHDGVPAILIGLKKAANSDPRILAPQQNQDFGWRLRAAMYALAAIGDRRALPAISTLTRYEVWKAARASEALSLVLAQGTPQQLQLDAKSESPGIAKAAQRLLDHPDELQTLRDKVVWMRRTTGGLPSSAKPGAIQTVPASPLPPGEPIAPPTSQPASSRIPALIGQLGTRPTEKNPAEQLDGQPPGGYYSTGGRRLPPGLRKGLNPPSCGSVHRTFFSAHASRPGARMKGRCFVTLSLPQRPSIEYLRKQAKSVLKRHNAGNAEVCLILRHLHRFTDATDEAVLSAELSLVEVQFALAMEYGFKDWNALKQHVESLEAVAAETASVSAPDAEPPWPELRRAIVAEAVAIGASDSHLEWHQGRLGVRQRVDGALRPSSIAISDDQQRAVIDGFKMMAALDTTVHDESQIGYCTCDVDGRRTSMRVSVIPYTSGESIAVRYLVNEPGLYNLGAQGWAAEDLTRLRQWISRPNGLIVVTGPAGSGRTTTIYGALHELASRGNLKIITAEDPVEYEVEGVLQQQVGPAEGVSYAQAIVAQMRQDPDVMMVGECRDLETLEGVLTVAMTGHLVLTTMHANDGPTCLRRILDFGIDPYRLAIAVIGVLAQRLVRRICPQCREQYEPPAWARQGLSDLPLGPMFKGKGCEACQNSGFRGRTVIAEMLEVDDATRLLIARNASAEEFRKQVSASGMRSLRAAGLARAPEGITTVDEVLRVCTG